MLDQNGGTEWGREGRGEVRNEGTGAWLKRRRMNKDKKEGFWVWKRNREGDAWGREGHGYGLGWRGEGRLRREEFRGKMEKGVRRRSRVRTKGEVKGRWGRKGARKG